MLNNFRSVPTSESKDETHENTLSWSKSLNSMFGIPKRNCTPEEILETIRALTESKQPRFGRFQPKALTLDEIREYAEIRNVQNATPKAVRECLIVLYREGRILHRAIDDNHRFLIK